jgi:hypothetical protein
MAAMLVAGGQDELDVRIPSQAAELTATTYPSMPLLVLAIHKIGYLSPLIGNEFIFAPDQLPDLAQLFPLSLVAVVLPR